MLPLLPLLLPPPPPPTTTTRRVEDGGAETKERGIFKKHTDQKTEHCYRYQVMNSTTRKRF
jgi:hypothetical protein